MSMGPSRNTCIYELTGDSDSSRAGLGSRGIRGRSGRRSRIISRRRGGSLSCSSDFSRSRSLAGDNVHNWARSSTPRRTSTQRRSVCLGTLLDRALACRIKEVVRSVGRVLSLVETHELCVARRGLAEHAVAREGRVGGEVRGSVLLGLTEGLCELDHLRSGRGVLLTSSI